MKSEKIMDSLNMLNDDILSETDKIRNTDKLKRPAAARWALAASAAACLMAVILAGTYMLLHKAPDNTAELMMLTIPENFAESFGFEGYMAYDISELVNANPWKKESKLSVLPVYKNALSYDENNIVSGADFDKMRGLLTETAERLGLDVNSLEITDDTPDEKTKQIITEKFQMAGGTVPDGYFEPTMLKIKTDDLKIEVDRSMTATISFKPEIPLPKEYNFSRRASYEEVLEVAEYLKNKYQKLISIKDPKINVHGGDYSIYLERSWSIEFFDAEGSDTEQIVNYNFNRIAFYGNDEGNLFIVRIFRPDMQKVGDYPIITADEAAVLLKEGNYITSVPYKMPGENYVAKAELLYRTGKSEQYYMPYYRFYAELPELERNGLKTYGAYYVPAVRQEYISNMPVWDGGFIN